MVRKIGATKKRRKAAPARRKTSRRRHRISGVGDMGGMLSKAGGLVVGACVARELNTLLVKMFPSIGSSPVMSGALQIAAGFVLPKFVKGAFVANMGDGMIANGGMVVVVSTGVISGISDRGAYRINGTSNLKVINGTNKLPVVNGPTTRISNVPTNVPRVMFKNFV